MTETPRTEAPRVEAPRAEITETLGRASKETALPETLPETLAEAALNDMAQRYQEHLNRVSRSFAFCIERLQSPLRAYVGLSYLICRILDTVEDAPWESAEAQSIAFECFDSFILVPPSAGAVAQWREAFPARIPEGEAILLQEAYEIFRDFHSLPEEVQAVLRDPILSMSRGMKHFMQRAQGGALRLRTLAEVNQYCFFVAGVVGEILTQLLWAGRGPLQLSVEELKGVSLEKAFRFGRFLQKVNLLKDQMSDEPEGRFLVPSRDIVLRSLIADADQAIDYVLSLPSRLVSYRLFCSWSLFLGLASMPWIQLSWEQKRLLKIPREKTTEVLGLVETKISDNKALREFFDAMLGGARVRAAKEPSPGEDFVPAPASVLELYVGGLSGDAVARLMSGAI